MAPKHRTMDSYPGVPRKTSQTSTRTMATDPRGNNNPIIMTARLGFRLLIPVLACAFAGCDTLRPSVGAVAGPDSSPATQNIPQSEANAPATTTDSAALEA